MMPKKEDDEDTTHAIVIADEKEGETENETAERTRLRITNPQNAKKTIETRRRRGRRGRRRTSPRRRSPRSRIPATCKSDMRTLMEDEKYYQEEEREQEDQETLPQSHES